MGKIRLTSFARPDLDSGIQHIIDNAYLRLPPGGGKAKLYATGLGSYQYGKKFEEELGIT